MRSVDVMDGICFAGLDVHARKTAAAAVLLGSGEVFKAQSPGSPAAVIGWLKMLPGEVRAVYEAGPAGVGLARAGRGGGGGGVGGSPAAVIGWLKMLPGEVRAVYEAGPAGFGLARAGRAAGIEVMVCSPDAIPRQPGDRVKTDARDALKLARLHAAGQLRPVVVSSRELEALRDLVRCRRYAGCS